MSAPVNSFAVLSDVNDENPHSNNQNDDKDSSTSASGEAQVSPSVNDESSWTVQSSTKRRLAPQHTLSRQDLGVDSPKNRAAQMEVTKKKVVRFTKEDLLKLRQPSKILPIMAELSNGIVSVPPLVPVTSRPFEADDFYQIWNADRDRERQQQQQQQQQGGNYNRGGPGRGHGGSAPGRGGGTGPGGNRSREGEWTRGSAPTDGTDIWDDVQVQDLADFSAMAMKFYADTKDLSQQDYSNDPESLRNREDPMERLFSEQSELAALELEDGDGDKEEDLPEWADDEMEAGVESEGPEAAQAASVASAESLAMKRNLLLNTLQVKGSGQAITAEAESQPSASETSTQPAPNVQDAYLTASVLEDVFGGLSRGGLGVNQAPLQQQQISTLVQQRPQHEHWLYLDPSNNVQGPFPCESMRSWHELGYFKMDLPVRLQSWGRFYPLGMVFPNANAAFSENDIPIEPRQMVPQPLPDAAAMTMIEMQRRQQEQQVAAALLAQRQQQEALYAAEMQQRMQLQQQHMMEEQERLRTEHQKQLVLAEQERQRQQQQHEQQMREFELQQQEQRQRELETQQQEQRQREQQMRLAQEQQQQQQLQMQRQQQQQQQQQQQAFREQQQKNIQSNAGPAWGQAGVGSRQTQGGPSPSLAELQRAEAAEERQQQGMSLQLKSLLGVSQQAGPEGGRGATTKASPAPWTASQSAQGSSTQTAEGGSGGGKTLRDIQLEEQREAQRQQLLLQQQLEQKQQQQRQTQKQEAASTAALNASLASWNKKPASAVKEAKPSPSLRDIMEQESMTLEQVRAREEAEIQAGRARAPGSWAAKLGVGSDRGYPASPPAATRTSGAAPAQKKVPTQAPSVTDGGVGRAVPELPKTAPGPPAAQPKPQSAPTAAGASAGAKKAKNSDFGGSAMSPGMSEWCAANIKKFTGSEDITLLQFCATLNSAGEIREYLGEYLGFSPQVSAFATEFIKRKESSGLSGTPAAVTGHPQTQCQGLPVPGASSGAAVQTTAAAKKKKPQQQAK